MISGYTACRLSLAFKATLHPVNLFSLLSHQAIEKNMRVQCKCHGVSGSCEMKTCWRAMPPFKEIGTVLKEKFDGATEVVMRRIGSRRQLVGEP